MTIEGPSPFPVGFGTPPEPLYGRDDQLAVLGDRARSLSERGFSSGTRLIGLRGTGKTSLLAEFERRLQDRHARGELLGTPQPSKWIVLRAEAGGDLEGALAQEIHEALHRVDPKGQWELSAGLDAFGVQASATRRNQPIPRAIDAGLRLVAREAGRRDHHVVVLVDELHEATQPQLRALAAGVNQRRPGTPGLMLVTAELPERLDIDRVSYFRDRAEQLRLGALSADACRIALTEPAARLRVSWDPHALEAVTRASGGYAYALALFGDETWRAAQGRPDLDLDAATAGIQAGSRRLDQLYSDRWERLTPRHQRYLATTARLGGDRPVATAEVAAALGDPITSWSGDVRELRKAGAIIHRRALVQVALPGWARWINREHGVTPVTHASPQLGHHQQPPTLPTETPSTDLEL